MRRHLPIVLRCLAVAIALLALAVVASWPRGWTHHQAMVLSVGGGHHVGFVSRQNGVVLTFTTGDPSRRPAAWYDSRLTPGDGYVVMDRAFAGFGYASSGARPGTTYQWWLVRLPAPVAIVALATTALACWLAARRVTPPADPSRCRACGYDLRATPARCPECGHAALAAGEER